MHGRAASAGSGCSMVRRLHKVCSDATEALSAAGAGVSVMTAEGVQGVAAASDADIERIEELQLTFGEGPCIDAFASRRPVLISDLDDGARQRWPVYTPAVHRAGIRAVFAFPLQIGAVRLGVFDLFRTRAGPLSKDEFGRAVSFAALAVEAVLGSQVDPAAEHELDVAIEGRAELYQAQGMVMVQLRGTLAQALVRMRAYAYAEDRRLSDVAADVVARRLSFHE